MIRKILCLACDHCGKQEPVECQTIKEATAAAKEMGWKAGKRLFCPYCRYLHSSR